MSEYEWVTRPPNTVERVIAGIMLIFMIVSWASSYAGWGVFGPYDGSVFAVSMIIGLLMLRFWPKVRRKPPV